MKFIQIFFSFSALGAAALLFQNCGQPFKVVEGSQAIEVLSSSAQPQLNSFEKVEIASTADFNQIEFDSTLSNSHFGPASPSNQPTSDGNYDHLTIDLTSRRLSYTSVSIQRGTPTSYKKECTTTDPRAEDLFNILKDSQICQIKAVQSSQTVNCLAMASSDIRLFHTQTGAELYLAKETCNTGIVLCDDREEALHRALLNDLVKTMPSECRNSAPQAYYN